jgi:hypothetical protein
VGSLWMPCLLILVSNIKKLEDAMIVSCMHACCVA